MGTRRVARLCIAAHDGVPIRLTGQDTERGTFSHRHIVLHDARTGERCTPIQELAEANASFEVYNSPLSEFACVGFEYGYSAAAPETLVLWEAQFGDFANGAQTIIDQFISSGLAKWRQTSRLTMLLPHGYEGNGPEHSSARLERFLQLAAQENVRIANCTTAAQYFHLLSRQALDGSARPLVVMTPKGLLRLKDAASSLSDLADGAFQPLLDATVADKAAVRRLVLCSGKLYYDIAHTRRRARTRQVAVARIEQLYPFPVGHGARPGRVVPEPRPRSSGRRRSRRTWARGGRFATASRRRPPAHRCASSAGRGVPARPRATRPRTCSSKSASCGPCSSARRARAGASRGGVGGLREPRPVDIRLREEQLPLTRRNAAPEIPRRECDTDASRRADASWSCHTSIVATGSRLVNMELVAAARRDRSMVVHNACPVASR